MENPKYKIVICKDYEGIHAKLYEQKRFLGFLNRWEWVYTSTNTLFYDNTVIAQIRQWQDNLEVVEIVDTFNIME